MPLDWHQGAYRAYVRIPNTAPAALLGDQPARTGARRDGRDGRRQRPVTTPRLQGSPQCRSRAAAELLDVVEDLAPERPPLPAGHPASWGAITQGTLLEGAPYPFPVFGAGSAA
jgi:hypothetical protein